MIRRAVRMLLVLLIFLLLLSPGSYIQAAVSASASPHVLLLYDSLGIGTSKEGNVAVLQRELAAFGVRVTWESIDQYEKGTMVDDNYVITVINNPDLNITNTAYLKDLDSYRGHYLHIGSNLPIKVGIELQVLTQTMSSGNVEIHTDGLFSNQLGVHDMPYIADKGTKAQAYGSLIFEGRAHDVPYAVRSGRSAYVPYLEKGNLSELAIAHVLKDWLSIPVTPQIYLLIKEIYPFSDLELLKQMADRLYRLGIPFIVSIRPVFSHTDYPAMQRYLEALKVVQDRNGTILVQAPVVMPSLNREDHTLKEKMESFIDLLGHSGIAPLGMGAEMYWTYDKEYAVAGMGFFDSTVLFPDVKVMQMVPTNTSATFTSSLYSMPFSFLQELHSTHKAMFSFPLSTAVTLDFPEGEGAMDEMLQQLETYWITFADYKQGDHGVVTGKNRILSAHGVITVNGEKLNTQYTPGKVDNNYQYIEKPKKSFTKLFSVQNQFFIVVIIISLLLFGGLYIIGYRLYRQKYLK